ncbi:hypothetical protein ACT3UJ_13120 [Halomonas sp. 86]|uniref:hypothetical protein n=1 Tax=unclassified Halomonas TaxID=2609666 RepID=UPI0040340854
MTVQTVSPMSAEEAQALATSLGLPLNSERAPLMAGVLHHIHTVIARLDELPIDESCTPSFAFDASQGNQPC